jgi:hypothetical protein
MTRMKNETQKKETKMRKKKMLKRVRTDRFGYRYKSSWR